MARPRDPSIPRIVSDTYRRGYAREYKGQWVIFLGRRKIYTGLKPTPDNADRVRRRLDAEIEHEQRGPTESTPIDRHTVPTLWVAVERWYDEHVEGNPDIGPAYTRTLQDSIRAYIGETDAPLGLAPGTVPALVDRMARERGKHRHASNTTARYMRNWKRIFGWCVAMGWLASNPIDLMTIPRLKTKTTDKRQYTPRELRGILRHFRELRRDDQEMYRLVLWLLATGMRISEALDMRWSDFHDGVIEIRGKGHRGKKKIRGFPVPPAREGSAPLDKWSRRMDWIMREQRRRSADLPDPDRVWRWAETTSPRRRMMHAKDKLGMESGDSRMLHTFRAMATHYMRHTLGFSREYVSRICGHSEAVMTTHYDREFEARDHARYLDGVSGPNES